MKRKYHLQDASKKTPAKTFYIIKSAQRTVIIGLMRLARAMVLARAPATPNSASFLACSFGSGYIWTADGGVNGMSIIVTRAKER